MKKNSLQPFFDVLLSKTKSRVLPKNKVSRLGLPMLDLFYFRPQSQNVLFRKRHSLNRSVFLFLLISFFGFTTTIAQTFPPASSCTSKDLLLVKASIPSDPCVTCTTGTFVSKPLTLAINNKTGSTRTSFAFWATYRIRNSGGGIVSTQSIQGCYGPIPKDATTSFLFGNITYPCGSTLELVNVRL